MKCRHCDRIFKNHGSTSTFTCHLERKHSLKFTGVQGSCFCWVGFFPTIYCLAFQVKRGCWSNSFLHGCCGWTFLPCSGQQQGDQKRIHHQGPSEAHHHQRNQTQGHGIWETGQGGAHFRPAEKEKSRRMLLTKSWLVDQHEEPKVHGHQHSWLFKSKWAQPNLDSWVHACCRRGANLVEGHLQKFGFAIEKDILGITTDGAALMKKVGRKLAVTHQACHNHRLHLAVTLVLYRKKVQIDELDEEKEDVTQKETQKRMKRVMRIRVTGSLPAPP